MSMATTFLCILFGINLVFFLLMPAEGNSPMIGIAKAFATGNIEDIDWGTLLTGKPYTDILSAIWNFLRYRALIIIFVAVMGGLSMATGQVSIFGVGGGGYGAVHAGLVIAIAIFCVFFLIPNFEAPVFGFPTDPVPIGLILNAFFGFGAAMAVFGLFKGGE